MPATRLSKKHRPRSGKGTLSSQYRRCAKQAKREVFTDNLAEGMRAMEHTLPITTAEGDELIDAAMEHTLPITTAEGDELIDAAVDQDHAWISGKKPLGKAPNAMGEFFPVNVGDRVTVRYTAHSGFKPGWYVAIIKKLLVDKDAVEIRGGFQDRTNGAFSEWCQLDFGEADEPTGEFTIGRGMDVFAYPKAATSHASPEALEKLWVEPKTLEQQLATSAAEKIELIATNTANTKTLQQQLATSAAEKIELIATNTANTKTLEQLLATSAAAKIEFKTLEQQLATTTAVNNSEKIELIATHAKTMQQQLATTTAAVSAKKTLERLFASTVSDNKTALEQLLATTAAEKKELIAVNHTALQQLQATTTTKNKELVATHSKAMAATYEGLMRLVAMIDASAAGPQNATTTGTTIDELPGPEELSRPEQLPRFVPRVSAAQ
ncbi:hypothetical protein T484DRAFT_1755491 [Baffinella frigidus]|nr:hypothetical protein T484DRAFT_1755491 [Cryptophyta sp. CCMP2293]